jgi:F0F1-type ATP synthase assembly protein I
MGVMSYVNAARHLDPLERFDWGFSAVLGLLNIWLPNTVLFGLLGLLIMGVSAVIHIVISRRRPAR